MGHKSILKVFVLYIGLIDIIFGDLKLSHNRQNGEDKIVSSANSLRGDVKITHSKLTNTCREHW